MRWSALVRVTDVMCWGINTAGQMGIGATSAMQVYAAPIMCP